MSSALFEKAEYIVHHPRAALEHAIDAQNIALARAALEQHFLQGSLPILEWRSLKKLLISNNRPFLRLIVPWLEPLTAMDIVMNEPKDYPVYIRQLRNAGMKIARLTLQEEVVLGAKTGDVMSDGSIYLGLHKEKDWFVAAKSLRITFNDAVSYVDNMRDHGHDDWQIPDGLVVPIMEHAKDVGAFAGTYHISKDYEGYWAHVVEDFPDRDPDSRETYVFGQKNIAWGGCLALMRRKDAAAMLRAVRSEPRLRKKP